MRLIAKTNPAEAAQATQATSSSVPRKRRYGSTRHTYDESPEAAAVNRMKIPFLEYASI